MKKIRVAFCLRDMQMGGVENVLIRTLDKLQKCKNIELSLITFVDVKTPIYKKYFAEHKNIKTYALYPCPWLSSQLPHFFLARIFVHILRDIYRATNRVFVMRKLKNIDVFIDYHDFGFAQELKNIKNAKKIAWFHSSVNVFVKRHFAKKLKYYDKCVVLTDACKSDLQNMFPKYADKIVRIYNPIDIGHIKNLADDKNKVRGKYFCCVSRLSGDKDIKTLLDGFDIFWNNNKKPDIKLVIVGDGSKSDEFKQYAITLKSGKNIVFVGAQKNPFVYMKNSLANILSSYGEGLPTVLLESAVLGTVNISSDCKYGPSEILLNGDAGLLYKPGNAQELAQCMDIVYNKKVNLAQMIQKADAALKRFDSNKIIKEIISLIS